MSLAFPLPRSWKPNPFSTFFVTPRNAIFEWLLSIIGILGTLGHLLHIHVLKSYWPGATEEISLPAAVGCALLGLAFYILIYHREELNSHQGMRWFYICTTVYLFLIGIGYIDAYIKATHFIPMDALLYSYPMSLTFVASIKALLIAFCLAGLLYWLGNPVVLYGTGLTALLFLGIDIYALGGHVFHVPILFNYKTSFPGIFASILISICLLRSTAKSDGLLAPLYSHMPWVRHTTIFSLCLAAALVFGGVLLSGRLEEMISQLSTNAKLTYLALEYGTIALASLITLFILRTIHFCGYARDSECKLQKLNGELEERVHTRTSELQEAVLRLENINREQKAFSYMVSYDLHAPLRIISGFIDMVRESAAPRLNEHEQDLLGRMQRRCQQLRLLVDELLDLSSVTHFRLQMDEIDLSLLARSIILDLKEQEPARNVHVNIQPDMILVGDNRLLTLVLQSLLQNAWKYTSKNPDAAIEFGCENIDGKPTYYVRDNGIGFNMADTHKLFHPFESLHSRGEFKGAGIGLAIAARAVERYQGTIWGAGKVNEGATFYFQLPKTAPADKPEEPEQSASAPATEPSLAAS